MVDIDPWGLMGLSKGSKRGRQMLGLFVVMRSKADICIRYSNLSIYIPWPFPPVWGVADNTKEQQKQWGPHSVPLAMTRDPAEFGWHCWSNTAHPPPSSTTYVASQMPSPLLPLPQGCPYKATPWQRQMPIRTASQSFATHSYS